ncbi:DNA ligase [Bienertia sinuspersici]
MKRLLKQRKARDISLTDEEIYCKITQKDLANVKSFEKKPIRQLMKLLKLRRKRSVLMSKKILTKKLKDAETENKVTRQFLEMFLNNLGYDLSEFNIDDDIKESNEEYENEEDKDDKK